MADESSAGPHLHLDPGCRVRACGYASEGRGPAKVAPDEPHPSPKRYIYSKLSMVGDYPDVKCFGKNEQNSFSSATSLCGGLEFGGGRREKFQTTVAFLFKNYFINVQQYQKYF